MIPLLRYALLPVAVVGLGKSGLGAAHALRAAGATPLVWDDNADVRKKAAEEGLKIVEPNTESWRKIDRVIWSPGIPHHLPKLHPAAAIADKLRKPLVCDVDLLCEATTSAVHIGITGTNGKSTTTALITHILNACDHTAVAAGNIGLPALEAPTLDITGSYVLELSSYQLELVPHLSLDVAVWTNITPDHLNRHGDLNGYIAAKRRLFDNPKPHAYAIIGIDDEPSATVYKELTRAGMLKVIGVSVNRPVDGGIYVRDGMLIDATGRRPIEVCDLKTMDTLPGAHNWQNAALAYATCRTRGIPTPRIIAAMASFPGLPHRQQKVAVIEDVAFINDSKATNADAASKAIACYNDILWIAGGLPKEGGIDSLPPLFGHIKHAFLIGQAAPDFARVLDEHKLPYTLCKTLQDAVEEADAMADRGDTVLLSPACASFDQFASFEQRGDVFMRIVQELAEDDGADDDAASDEEDA